MPKEDATQHVDAIWDMSEDELYKHLGMASLGTENISEAVRSMKFLLSTAANTDGAISTQTLTNTLLEHGRKYFDKLWNELKDVICFIYREGQAVGDKKDLSAYIVGILVAAGRIANPLATLVVAIAVKKGLDRLCSAR